ncbi:hypothetical protein HYU19_05390 [Candidatus Woesearchaeota archaeon]|nr:hypothetical protein [Candidatus Woesearchaeota archaeon]
MQLLKLLKRQESPLELADLPLPPLPSLPSIEGKIDGKLCSDELDFGLPPLPDEIEERKSPARALPPRPVLGLPPLPPPPKPSKGKSTTCLPEFSAPFPKRENVKPMPRPPLPSFSLPPLPPPPAEAPRPVAPFPKLYLVPQASSGARPGSSCCAS